MAEAFSTAAAVVSFVDVMIRACRGISQTIISLNEAPSTIHRLRDTIQNLQSVLRGLRLFVTEYQSSKVFLEHHQLLPDNLQKELLAMDSELKMLQRMIPPSANGSMNQKFKWLSKEKKILDVAHNLECRQKTVVTELQLVAQ